MTDIAEVAQALDIELDPGSSSSHHLVGTSMSGATVRTGTRDQQRVVLKVSLHAERDLDLAAKREFFALQHLNAVSAGPRMAPPLVAWLRNPELTAVVLPLLSPLPRPLTRELLADLMSGLAMLHTSPPPNDETDSSDETDPSDNTSAWRFPRWEGLDPDSDRDTLTALWSTAETRSALDWTLAHRDSLLRAATAGPECFVHGDCHLDNALVGDGGRVLLVDWQSAGIGRGTDDLAFLLTRGIDQSPGLPRSWLVEQYATRTSTAASDVDRAVTARQLLTLTLQYPAFSAHLSADSRDRLTAGFSSLHESAARMAW